MSNHSDIKCEMEIDSSIIEIGDNEAEVEKMDNPNGESSSSDVVEPGVSQQKSEYHRATQCEQWLLNSLILIIFSLFNNCRW